MDTHDDGYNEIGACDSTARRRAGAQISVPGGLVETDRDLDGVAARRGCRQRKEGAAVAFAGRQPVKLERKTLLAGRGTIDLGRYRQRPLRRWSLREQVH